MADGRRGLDHGWRLTKYLVTVTVFLAFVSSAILIWRFKEEFESHKFSGKIVPELLDLAQRGIARFMAIVQDQMTFSGLAG